MIASTNIVWPNVAIVAKGMDYSLGDCNYQIYREFIKSRFLDPDLVISFTTVLKATQYEVINWHNYIGVQYNRESEIALVHGSFKQWLVFIDYIINNYQSSHNIYRQLIAFLIELKALRLLNLELDKDGKVMKWKALD